MSFTTLLILVAVLFVGIVVVMVVDQQRKKKAMEEMMDTAGFEATQQFLQGDTGIAVDERTKSVMLLQVGSEPRKIRYRDLLSSELVQDGVTVTSEKRKGTISRALVGGVLAGGVGAVIGGLSAGSKGRSTNKVSKLELVIAVNDTANPIHRVVFHSGAEFDEQGMLFKGLKKQAQEWHGRVAAMIRQANEEDAASARSEAASAVPGSAPSPQSRQTIGEELTRLAQLKKDGFLTDEEFAAEKKKLLSRE